MRVVLLLLIRCYRHWLSPMLGPSCRFTPTCSAYAEEALRQHGSGKGGLLTLWRLLRCQPWARHGYDPVPPRGAWRHPDRHLEK
jgi:uncharacterized protein